MIIEDARKAASDMDRAAEELRDMTEQDPEALRQLRDEEVEKAKQAEQEAQRAVRALTDAIAGVEMVRAVSPDVQHARKVKAKNRARAKKARSSRRRNR